MKSIPNFSPKVRTETSDATTIKSESERNIFLFLMMNIQSRNYLVGTFDFLTEESPEPKIKRVKPFDRSIPNASKNTRVIPIAEIIETTTPSISVKANPLISDVPNQNKITAVISVEIFESRIESHARAKPARIASGIL